MNAFDFGRMVKQALGPAATPASPESLARTTNPPAAPTQTTLMPQLGTQAERNMMGDVQDKLEAQGRLPAYGGAATAEASRNNPQAVGAREFMNELGAKSNPGMTDYMLNGPGRYNQEGTKRVPYPIRGTGRTGSVPSLPPAVAFPEWGLGGR